MPRELKGSLIAQIDRAFLGVLAASLIAHFAGASWLVLQPMPPDEELSMEALVPDRFARQQLPPVAPPPKPATDATRPPESANAPVAAKPRPSTPAPQVAHSDLRTQVTHLGLLNVIGARGEGHSGIDDVLSSASITDVAQALDGATNVRLATADDLTASQQPHGGQVGEVTTISGLGMKGPVQQLNLHDVAQAVVQGRAQSEGPQVGKGDILQTDLAKWMKSRTPAIQSCYEHELKRNRSLHGRLVVRFSITPRGRTSNVDIEENNLGNDEVGRCISNLVSHWVLPFTPEDEVSVSFPWVFSPVN